MMNNDIQTWLDLEFYYSNLVLKKCMFVLDLIFAGDYISVGTLYCP